MPPVDVAEYCRDLETYMCRKNDGHLMRIVGPSFELVSRWALQGVPVKVAMGGIDRYFERYYRKGPRRRPAKIDFCEADVLDVFDEWRRATGLSASGVVAPEGDAGPSPSRKGPTLPEHIERALLRLSNLRATGVLGSWADPLLDTVSSELDQARRSGGVRGEERRVLVARLEQHDTALLDLVRSHTSDVVLREVRDEASADLAAFRAGMPSDAFDRAVDLAATRALRERLGLPVLTFA